MRYLIVRPDRLGDMILTLPMATVLRKGDWSPLQDHGSPVVVLASTYNAPIAEWCDDVDEVIAVEQDADTEQLIKAMKRARADVAFFPVPSLRLAYAGWRAGIPFRVGTGYRWYSFLFNKKIYEHRKTAERNEAEYNVGMLKALSHPQINWVPPATAYPRLSLPDSAVVGLPASYIVLHVPTGGSAPAWGIENFVKLADSILKQTPYDIVFTGSPGEREFLFTVAEKLKLHAPKVHIRTSDTLIELAHVLQRARLVVSGSTGPGHIAAALGTRTVGLFPLKKQLSRERWGFRGFDVRNLAPQKPLRSECPDCKECSCISSITADEVMGAIKGFSI